MSADLIDGRADEPELMTLIPELRADPQISAVLLLLVHHAVLAAQTHRDVRPDAVWPAVGSARRKLVASR